ncbi:MAG: amidohydrolase [Cyclobacteriaceae bacterium]
MQDLKVTLLQADLHWEQPAANMAMLEEMIWSEVSETDVIILPEMFTTGFSMNAKALAEPPRTNTYRWMRQVAREKKALILGSFITRDEGKYYNRMHAVFPNGTVQYYDKRHLFTLANEQSSYSAGNKRLIVEWKGWKICPLVCYDLRFPVYSRNGFNQESRNFEYDVLVYSANWPESRVQAWDALVKARAIENQSYVIAVNRVGRDGNGHAYNGHSGVYDYLGEPLNSIGSPAYAIEVLLEKNKLDEFREKYAFLNDSDDFKLLD